LPPSLRRAGVALPLRRAGAALPLRRVGAAGWLVRPVKRMLRRYRLPLYELRNKVLLAHTVPAVWRFESAEVRRLRAALPPRPPRLVTTVIPTYRRPAELLVAVRSALAQTVRDHTVIVVDDGAGLPDDLPDDPRLVAVSLSRNTGVLGVVRNVGIRLADSQFVAFLDDDNEWEPDHLAVALTALRASAGAAGAGGAGAAGPGAAGPGGERLDAVYTAMRRLYADGTEMDVLSVPFDRRRARIYAFLDANPFVARRSAALRFSRLRRDPGVLPREDWATLFRYSRRHRVAHVPQPTVRYLVNTNTYYTVWD
jgi:glycosyltransferase involved in cell wall biosynthesis